MKTYIKIMQYFWLTLAVLVFIITTYKGFTEGFDRWAVYYGFSAAALLFFFIRKYMAKRMEKHQVFLQQQKEEKGKTTPKG